MEICKKWNDHDHQNNLHIVQCAFYVITVKSRVYSRPVYYSILDTLRWQYISIKIPLHIGGIQQLRGQEEGGGGPLTVHVDKKLVISER